MFMCNIWTSLAFCLANMSRWRKSTRRLRVYAMILRTAVRTSERQSEDSRYMSGYSEHPFGHPDSPDTPDLVSGHSGQWPGHSGFPLKHSQKGHFHFFFEGTCFTVWFICSTIAHAHTLYYRIKRTGVMLSNTKTHLSASVEGPINRSSVNTS